MRSNKDMSSYYETPQRPDEIYHHGILNQKWGIRNGPPYPLKGGSYSRSEIAAIKLKRKNVKNSIYNKKHFDDVIKRDKTLTTLSYDKDRTKNTDMFYAAHDKFDKHQYNALFNKKIPSELYDSNGKSIGRGNFLKFKIDNGIKRDLKIASEDSGASVFKDLYRKDRDFYNFVMDSKRMESYFDKSKYKFKGYRESAKALNTIRSDRSKPPSEKDVNTLYRMFNYVIPYNGEKRGGHDVRTQRAKFFTECKKRGYGAVLDTNDSIYGGYKTRSSVIVFDMGSIIPKSVRRTTLRSKQVSKAAYIYRKLTRK